MKILSIYQVHKIMLFIQLYYSGCFSKTEQEGYFHTLAYTDES